MKRRKTKCRLCNRKFVRIVKHYTKRHKAYVTWMFREMDLIPSGIKGR